MSVEEFIAAAGGSVAIVGLPAYIGWSDRTLGVFLIYALVAGFALAVTDRLTITCLRGESAMALFQHAIFRCVSVALLGGVVYALLIMAV